METFVVKDSGKRQGFETGAHRDIQEGKGDFSLLPFEPLVRLAELYRKGAAKYDRNNWRKGIPLSRWISSLRRHAIQAGQPERDTEDHFAAVCFNAFGFMYTEAMIRNGKLPRTLDDIGWLDQESAGGVVEAVADPDFLQLFNRGEGYTLPEKGSDRPPPSGSSGEQKESLQATSSGNVDSQDRREDGAGQDNGLTIHSNLSFENGGEPGRIGF